MGLFSFVGKIFQKEQPEQKADVPYSNIDDFMIGSDGRISMAVVNSPFCKKNSKRWTINCPEFKRAFDRDLGTFDCKYNNGKYKFTWITDNRAVGNNLTGVCGKRKGE